MTNLLKPREVAEQLGVSLSTVERLVSSGAFAGGVVRFGGNTRITREALGVFISAHTDGVGPNEKKSSEATVKSENRPTFAVMTDNSHISQPTARRVIKRETTAADAISRAQAGAR